VKCSVVSLSLLILLSISAGSLCAQDPDAFGIWVRGERRYDPKEFAYKGIEVNVHWKQLEPSDGVFDWKVIDTGLEKATNLGLYTCVGVTVGPLSPRWLYEKGVPMVMTQGHVRSGPYPYYLDPRHVFYYHRLIEQLGRHLRDLPPHIVRRVVFAMVMTGSTQDEAPYKGTPSPAKYAITNEQWHDFRLAAVQKFMAAFQQGPGPVIPLQFNGLMSWSDESLGRWVRTNVHGGWAHKQPSGFCYQLNDEAQRAPEYVPHLIDPAPDDYAFFTRCELDRGWEKGIFFKPNVRMSFYWTALSALHSGLNIWELTGSARDWCREHDYWDFARFFNKYAGQTRSPVASGAFCALHQGLDAADTKQFPEAEFGEASHDNPQRYLAICAAFAAHGAKMDSVEGVLRNQTNQRNTQQGLNDAGWKIFPGNYERFLRQIDPDQTSVGWWRVGGEVTESTPVYARFARGFDHAHDKDAMYFDIEDGFFSGKPLAAEYPVRVRIVYYDRGSGRWSLKYDAVTDRQKLACEVTKTDSGTWKEEIVTLRDANFGNRGPRGADLMLVNSDAEDDIFHMIEVSRTKP
jgi:hypothetical protein